MGWQCLLLLLSSLYYSCTCQVTIPPTDPPVATNGGTVDLPAVENATNVSMFCELSFNDMGNIVLVDIFWRLGSGIGMTPQFILFGEPEYSNFVLENVSRFTNLTILSFSRSLDMMILECSNGFTAGGGVNLQNAFFVPRFIG